jgi:hypothetical protein
MKYEARNTWDEHKTDNANFGLESQWRGAVGTYITKYKLFVRW